MIHAVLPRKNYFSRKTAGVRTDEQVIAANIDTVFIVSGLDNDFNIARIERYLTLAWDHGVSPVIILNKADICDDLEEYVADVEAIAFDVPVCAVSAEQDDGLDALYTYLETGMTSVLLGSSGVGKSTIVNKLLDTDRQKVKSVRDDCGKGQHTTTHRELLFLPSGGMIIDTPGMRELQVWGTEEGLHESYADIEELESQCRFHDCSHDREPGCAVKEAIEEGELDSKRFKSYCKLKKEFQYLAMKQDQKKQQDSKNWKKKISVWSKAMKKHGHIRY